PIAQWWNGQKQPPALFMSRRELERSTDVFTIELLDMKQHHRVLFGEEDALRYLHIPMDLHRVQVEYELREKLILLRQQLLLVSGNAKQLGDLLLRSAPSFATLFRHALIVLGDSVHHGKREAVETLSKQLDFDASAMHEVLDVRERKASPKTTDVNGLAARYLTAIERVTEAVDKA
ncbi:MAG TPA: hypothetical protein VKZ53_16795, partial [Candidatus Angelobacter sp.]|nr:hypothetical protein [Candidatus Angelobacter sp.]